MSTRRSAQRHASRTTRRERITPKRRALDTALGLTALSFALTLAARPAQADEARAVVKIGSKRFTESFILAEIGATLLREGDDAEVRHIAGLGGTAVTYRALEEGSVDLYPEYTGTVVEAILHGEGTSDIASIRRILEPRGIGITRSLGFNNTYAIAVPRALAEQKHIARLSDLARFPDLRLGMTHEFMGRSDGWPGLAARYDLKQNSAAGLDHGLAYEAIRKGTIDATDVYSTDAKIKRFDLQVLDDDRRFFPRYEAVFLYRRDLATRAPRAFASLERLEGAIDEATMIDLNGKVELDGMTFASVGESFARAHFGGAGAPGSAGAARPLEARRSLLRGILETVRTEGPRHLALSLGALLLSTLIGVPTGILATRSRALGRTLLTLASIVQTIPSLALLCFFIPLLGTGPLPALVALFLYGLLPIARNTAAGIESIPASLLESAEVLGLSPRAQLFSVKLPLASHTILAGIKTSAIVNIGTATLAAFIGAGGFGAPISTGLNLNDTTLILEGAIPAAALALLAEGLFGLLDRALIPRGLRLADSGGASRS